MNIDFVRWLCEKAEGFGFLVIGGKAYVMFKTGRGTISDLRNNPMTYPLLLQRAIEGVNRKNERYVITQDETGLYVLDKENNGMCVDSQTANTLFEWDKIKPDAAKEAALKWVWENDQIRTR